MLKSWQLFKDYYTTQTAVCFFILGLIWYYTGKGLVKSEGCIKVLKRAFKYLPGGFMLLFIRFKSPLMQYNAHFVNCDSI